MTNGKVYENILRQHDASELDQRVRAAQLREARKQVGLPQLSGVRESENSSALLLILAWLHFCPI